jgi:hypothetical protein
MSITTTAPREVAGVLTAAAAWLGRPQLLSSPVWP